MKAAWLAVGKGQEPPAHLRVHLLPEDPELLGLPEPLLGLLIPQRPEVGPRHTVGPQRLQLLKGPDTVLFRRRSNLVFSTLTNARRAHLAPRQTPACPHQTSTRLRRLMQVCLPLHEGSPESSGLTHEKQVPVDEQSRISTALKSGCTPNSELARHLCPRFLLSLK